MSAIALQGWAVHLLGSVVLAAAAWGAGLLLQRALRLSPAAPAFWTGVWALAVVPPLLALALVWVLPAPLAALPVALPLPVALSGEAPAAGGEITVATGLGWPSLSAVLVCAWLAGVSVVMLRLLQGMAVAHRIQRQSHPITDAHWPGALSREQARQLEQGGITLRCTSRAMTPFALRWPRRTILLPVHALQHFSDRQLRLVLRHEATHLQRRDPQRAGLMALVGALLWFNPFVRWIAARVQLAAELRCDALALADDPGAGREYAGAYLIALRLAGHGNTAAPLSALTHRDMAGHQLRIRHMLQGGRQPVPPRALRWALAMVGTVAAATVAVVQAATLSPAPLPHMPPVAALRPLATPKPTAPPASVNMTFDAPLERMRVTGHYGDTGAPRQRTHRGTDFAARVGTPVHAPADATVIAATDRYPEGPQYGTVVVLDHGQGWQTLYAHLDSTDLKVGQTVRRGDQIARSGRSGRVTGPHLHMELLFNGERRDPLTHLH